MGRLPLCLWRRLPQTNIFLNFWYIYCCQLFGLEFVYEQVRWERASNRGRLKKKVISRGSKLTTQPIYQSQNSNHKKLLSLEGWINVHFLIPCLFVCLYVCVVWKFCPSELDRRKMKAHGIFLPLKNGSQHPLCFFPERSERRRRPKSWSSRLLPSRPTMSSHVQHADWIWDLDLDYRLKI